MPVRKKQSALFYDWPENMGVDVPYRDSMEGTWIDPSSSASAQCIVIVFINDLFTLYRLQICWSNGRRDILRSFEMSESCGRKNVRMQEDEAEV